MSKQLIGVIILSVITVVIWIGFEVWMRFGVEDIQLNYKDYLESVNGEFDEETLQELAARESEYMLIETDELD